MSDHKDDDPISMSIRVLRQPLYQDRMWVTKDKRRLLIEDMSASHRYNLLQYLRRKAGLYANVNIMMPHNFIAIDEVEEMDWKLDHPEEWLETLPLVKRLRALVEQDLQSEEVWF
jgi:hypothetical protein